MTDTRKGALLPEQEQKIIRVVKAMVDNKLVKAAVTPAVILADNVGIEAAKKKLVEKYGPEVLEDVYPIVDTIIDAIPEPEETEG